MKPINVNRTQVISQKRKSLIPIAQYKIWLKNELARGNTKNVIRTLYEIIPQNTDLHEVIIYISNQYAENERNQRLGMGYDSVHARSLVTSLIGLIDTLDLYLPKQVLMEYEERIEVPLYEGSNKATKQKSSILLLFVSILIVTLTVYFLFIREGESYNFTEPIRKNDPSSINRSADLDPLDKITHKPYYIVVKSFNSYDLAYEFAKKNASWKIDILYLEVTDKYSKKKPTFRSVILGFSTEADVNSHLRKVKRKWRKAWKTMIGKEKCDFIGFEEADGLYYTCLNKPQR